MWLIEDRERLKRFRAGEATVLAEVYALYSPGIALALSNEMTVTVNGAHYRFRGTVSAFDVDDLLQETFVRAFGEQARLSYDGLRPFRAYLLTIARNLLVDRF